MTRLVKKTSPLCSDEIMCCLLTLSTGDLAPGVKTVDGPRDACTNETEQSYLRV